MSFSHVAIIYNPNSTGPSRQLAEELAERLRQGGLTAVELVATKRVGHAEELATQLATRHDRLLIISSSGDGGYHEVINGVMRAIDRGHPAVTAVLPAGNANDHRRTVERAPLDEGILAGRVTRLDLLRATITTAGQTTTRYAHSYIGLGLTPVVATELNRHTLNAWREMLIVIRAFYRLQPFVIRVAGEDVAFNSLIFSNIRQMAKALTLSQTGNPQDGAFEVTAISAGSKLHLLGQLLRSAVRGLQADKRVTDYGFEVIKPMPMQLDGELAQLEPDTKVRVEIVPGVLETIL